MNTSLAVSKLTPCFRRFAAAFLGVHEKVGMAETYTDVPYMSIWYAAFGKKMRRSRWTASASAERRVNTRAC